MNTCGRLITLNRPAKLFLVSFIFLIVLLGAGSLLSPAKTNAAYEAGRLIDDEVFLNSNSMNASQIQSFLTARGSGLANMNFTLQCYGSDSKERQWYTAAGASCDTSIPASQIIYYAAQIYGVNPQVILATMQKEQSLTTAPNPTSWQLNQAMGYACPTSGQCGGNSTFPYQIDSGTWALRYHYERARGNMNWWHASTTWTCGTGKPNYYMPNLYPGQNVQFIDPYSNIQYATVFISNAATSAFYCYTPHVYNNHTNSPHPDELKGTSRCYPSSIHPPMGDRGRCYTGSFNFVYWFEQWFGSTIGSLVKTSTSDTVYLLSGNMAYPISSVNILNDYAAMGPIRITTSAEINQYTSGPTLSNMVGGPDGTIYLVNASIKLPFTSCSLVAEYGYSCGQVNYLADGQLNRLHAGPHVTRLMKSSTGSTVFYVSAGKKRPIAGWEVLLSLKIPIVINAFSSTFINSNLPTGPTLYRPGTLIKEPTSYSVYVTKSPTEIMPVTNFIFPQELGLGTSVKTISTSDLQTYTTLGNNLSSRIQCNGISYLATRGNLHKVSTSMMTEYGFNSLAFLDVGSVFCERLKYSIQDLNVFIRIQDGTIYKVQGGQKRAFTSFSTYLSQGGNSENTVLVSDFAASLVVSGPNM